MHGEGSRKGPKKNGGGSAGLEGKTMYQLVAHPIALVDTPHAIARNISVLTANVATCLFRPDFCSGQKSGLNRQVATIVH